MAVLSGSGDGKKLPCDEPRWRGRRVSGLEAVFALLLLLLHNIEYGGGGGGGVGGVLVAGGAGSFLGAGDNGGVGGPGIFLHIVLAGGLVNLGCFFLLSLSHSNLVLVVVAGRVAGDHLEIEIQHGILSDGAFLVGESLKPKWVSAKIWKPYDASKALSREGQSSKEAEQEDECNMEKQIKLERERERVAIGDEREGMSEE